MAFDYHSLDPQLRFRGRLLKMVQPLSMPPFTKSANRLLEALFTRNMTKSASYQSLTIPRPDGSPLRLCIYRPKVCPPGPLPGVLWIHGGGYLMGIPEQDFGFVDRILEAAPCVVVAPDYRRSVDAPYPAALEDCDTAWAWMTAQTEALGIDGARRIIGGDSAGGGLCVALGLYLRDRGAEGPCLQLPLYPMLDCRPTGTNQNNDAPGWNSRSNDLAWKLYLDGLPAEKYAAPALETDWQGLAPALTFVGDVEPFLEETKNYVNQMRAAGVSTAFRVYPGCFHGFDMLARGEKSDAASAFFIENLRSFLKTGSFVSGSEEEHAV